MQIVNQLTNSIQVRKHFLITLSGTIFGIFITYFIVSGDAVDSNSTTSLGVFELISSICIGVIGAYWMGFSVNFLDKLLPWYKHEGNRLLTGILVHYIIIMLWSFTALYLICLLFNENLNFQEVYNKYAIKLGIVLFILVLIFEIIYFALYSYYSYTTFQIATVRQERKQIELQLKALKAQLSPHFLFNSLNTISSLIFKDKMKAESFIRRLAEMYQYTLDSYQIKLTSLEKELDFVYSYQYLLNTRFGDKFKCSIDIDKSLYDTKMPPLTLQMLLENAVKHNVLDDKTPLNVKITSDKKHIIVQNNITKEPKQIASFKIGLKNINSRYLLLHTEGILVTKGESFEVKIPIIS